MHNSYRKRKTGILCLGLVMLAVSANLVASKHHETVEGLVHNFVKAFNSSDNETMAAFYQQSASTSFNSRRTEQEDRALYAQIMGMVGTLTIKDIETQDSENILVTVLTSKSDSENEIRMKLVGHPAKIDGFTIGIPPRAEQKDFYSESEEKQGYESSNNVADSGPFAFLTSTKKIYQSQVLIQSDTSLLLVWVQKSPHQLDLFVARQLQDGEFSQPLQINLQGLNSFTGDEARPDVALGKNGAVAIVWTAANNDIMMAVGSEFGTAFDAPLKLNQDNQHASRTMPTVSFSPDGAANAVWLDPRIAPRGMEEPSDLYLATVINGKAIESNLTANQEQTVCGCCRPSITINQEGIFDIAFRNADSDGYRDISRISGTSDSLSEPQATSPPIWKLNACPSAGPVTSQGGTLWKDASTGDWRMLWSTDVDEAPTVLFKYQPDLELTRSPRVVSGRENWILIGGNDHSLITTLNDSSWEVLYDNLPAWAASAAVRNGELIMVGNRKGSLLSSIQSL